VICYAQALDRAVAEAGRHGVRLILSLANNLEVFGGKTQYVKWALEEGVGLSASNDSFFFDPSIRDYFKVYLKVSSAGSSSSVASFFTDGAFAAGCGCRRC
jgi:endo-1,4-beta-mannosidase